MESVTLTLTASGSVSDFSNTTSLQQKLATAAGIDKSLVTISVAAASVIITAKFQVPDSTTGTAVKGALITYLGANAESASKYLGITVESKTLAGMNTGSWMSIAAPPPPSNPPSPPSNPSPAAPMTHKRNTAVLRGLMARWGAGRNYGCEAVSPTYNASLTFNGAPDPFRSCVTAKGNIQNVVIGPLTVSMEDLCPGTCSTRSDSGGTAELTDHVIVIYTVAGNPTCSNLNFANTGYGGWCADPFYNFLCGATCRSGGAYDDCAVAKFGLDRYTADCKSEPNNYGYSTVEQCIADAGNYVTDTFGVCPKASGVSCYNTRAAMGAGACPS